MSFTDMSVTGYNSGYQSQVSSALSNLILSSSVSALIEQKLAFCFGLNS